MERLESRFGNPVAISHEFYNRLSNWIRLGPSDNKGLREFSDFLQQCCVAKVVYTSLNILDSEKENCMLCIKLPDWLANRWIRHAAKFRQAYNYFPSFEDFANFLMKESDIACDPVLSMRSVVEARKKLSSSQPERKVVAHSVKSSTTKRYCFHCEKDHYLFSCESFAELPLVGRFEVVKRHKLCFNCLRTGHSSKQCSFKLLCKLCKSKHSTLLHNPDSNIKNKESETELTQPNTVDEAVAHFSTNSSIRKCSMIVPVYISHKSNSKKEVLTYAMLDSMSDSTFITENTLQKLGVTGISVKLSLSTLNNKNEVVSCTKVSGLKVRGYEIEETIDLLPVFSSKCIPANRDHIPTYEKVRGWKHLNFLKDKLPPVLDCPVGMIIGFDCPTALSPIYVKPPINFAPFGQRTKLGWGVVGCVNEDGCYSSSNHSTVSYEVVDDTGLNVSHRSSYCFKTAVREISNEQVTSLLEQDFKCSAPDEVTMAIEDQRFISLMKEGIKQVNGKHYSMPLPFKETEQPTLPCNKPTAIRRLTNLRKRFIKEPKYFDDYSKFMSKLLVNNHAEKVPIDELDKPGKVWYLPHHGVYHPRKPDKIRVVFDGSTSYQGIVLNNLLLKGPDLNNTLVGVLTRFRKEPVAFTCDVEQMFYNFLVTGSYRDYLRFLWYEDCDLSKQPTVYRMNKHLFGASSSPNCANFGMKQLTQDFKTDSNAEACSFVKTNFYMDDGLASTSSDEKAISLIKDTVSLCDKIGLNLHKFTTNSKTVRQYVNDVYSTERLKELPGSPERLLGVIWCCESDTFQFRVTINNKPLTRRGILSIVSTIYDPLGFIAPFILEGKKILQCMCSESGNWDDEISSELLPRWERWLTFVHNLDQIQIPRSFKGSAEIKSAELHHFSDASYKGYGQCSYLKIIDVNDEITCSLVMGKSRVSPLKAVTIPRLELTAGLVSCKVSNLLNKELNLDVTNYYWIDSQVVLSYISNESKRFHIYVSNRVQQIRELSNVKEWNYIPTDLNPADDASRGMSLENIDNNCRWFKGPDFLYKHKFPQFGIKHTDLDESDPEVKVKCYFATSESNCDNFHLLESMSKFSSWYRAKRAVANCHKFAKIWYRKSVLKQSIEYTSCSASDLKEAEIVILKLTQLFYFKDELVCLESQKPVHKSSSLYTHNIILHNGVLRVGGRLSQSSLNFEEKHPLILPSAKVSHVSKLMIMYYHEKCLHQGRGITVNTIRRAGYWIVSLVSGVASVIFKCITCRRLYKPYIVQKMADLPCDRVEEAPPFTFSAVDVFGPYHVKSGRKSVKRYAVLFTCLCCRAIHIEVANSLSTDSFINAFRRFVSIRGTVSLLRSDCGTNFIGCERELRFELDKIDNEKVKVHLARESCEFKFNVPTASHAGGVWERQIRSVRRVMSSLLKDVGTQFDEECLQTFLCEACAIVNSRPLNAENLSDSDFVPITPNSFLTMKPSIVLPPPGEFPREDLYSKRRYRRCQYLANQFWIRWRSEYLQNLQVRSKWQKSSTNIKIGDDKVRRDEMGC